MDTDSYRGVLISNHVGKVLTGLIQDHVTPSYVNFVGATQFGAVPKMGTALASHIVRSFIDYARLAGLSMFVLFVDLSKAFDKVIREIALGSAHGAPESVELSLEQLGHNSHVVKTVVDLVSQHGTVFEQMGIDGKVRELITSLHSGSWFSVGASSNYVVARSGGRQGCKLGAILFNLIYAVALARLRNSMMRSHGALEIQGYSGSPFWGNSYVKATPESKHAGQDGHKHFVVDVTFVDDEAILLTSPSPRRLEIAFEGLLKNLCEIFSSLGLVLNFSPGKSEAFLVFRGKNAAKYTKKYTVQQKCRILLPPGANAEYLRVVQQYKHLGSIISADGTCTFDIARRTASAMTAYAPIAVSVFGSMSISRNTRLNLFRSLVISRLLYNVHVWSEVSVWSLRKLNHVYMRGLRRIAGQCRYQAGGLTDERIRELMEAPSIDSMIVSRRLLYLPSVLSSPAVSLRALLSVCVGPESRRLPWSQLILSDLRSLKLFYHSKLAELGDPLVDGQKWQALILDYPSQWKELVKGFRFSSSILDAHSTCHRRRTHEHECVTIPMHAADTCRICLQNGSSVHFPTRRALATHARIAHGERSMVKQYIGTNMCPACGVTFSTRLRCIAHATDKRVRGARKKSCFQLLCTGLFPKVDPVTLRELDQQDTRHRREARHVGRTQPKSTAPHSKPNGNSGIDHVVKRRRLFYKQPSDSLYFDMYLPRGS